MTEQQTLVEFLEKRLQEDQEAAELMAKYYPPPWDVYDRGWMARVYGDYPFWEVIRLEQGPWVDNDSPPLSEIIEHIARQDPARILREVESKRKIVEAASITLDIYTGFSPFMDFITETLRRLAVVWDEHPDYDQAWRPFGEAYREEWCP